MVRRRLRRRREGLEDGPHRGPQRVGGSSAVVSGAVGVVLSTRRMSGPSTLANPSSRPSSSALSHTSLIARGTPRLAPWISVTASRVNIETSEPATESR